jgi:hypothetical protein
MKRFILVLPAALVSVVLLAGAALAQYPPTPGSDGGEPPGASGGTAFTGASISLGLLIVGALVVLGIAALLMSRRRAPAE